MSSAIESADTFVIPEATEKELEQSIEHAARFYLGISSDEFLRRLKSGELAEDDPQVGHVLYVINFIRSAKGAQASIIAQQSVCCARKPVR